MVVGNSICRKLLISCLLLAVLATASGCAGKREINDLAMVMAVGLDKGKKKGYIELTAQVVRPADARGQTGAPSGGTGDPIWSASSEGPSIFAAIRNLASYSSRRVFWAHNYAIVINEDLAKEQGIAEILDFFTRNPELRMRTWIVVTPDKAKDVVSTLTGLELIPGEAIDKLFRYSNISAAAPHTELLDVQSAYLGEITEPIMARVKLIDRGVSNKKKGQAGAIKQIELAGTGVFKGDKLVGTLDREETRGLLPFVESTNAGVIVTSCPSNKKKRITIEVIYERFNVQPKIEDGRVHFYIKMKTHTNMVEAGCPFSLEDHEMVAQLEKQIKDEIAGHIEVVLEKAQKDYKADFLELGKVFQNKYPAEWKAMKGKWETAFVNAKMHVDVQAEIKGSVLLYNPTKSGKQDDKE